VIRVSRQTVVHALALLAVSLLACDDDTSVVVAVGQPIPPGNQPPQGGGAVIVVTHGELDRNATADRASSGAAESARSRVHVDRLYFPSPGGPARIAADDHAIAVDPGEGGKNYDNDTNVDFGDDAAPRHAFLRVELRDIPRRARILDATLQILARQADAQPGCDVYVGFVPRDGRWNDLRRPLQWSRAPSLDAIASAHGEGGELLATTGLTPPGSSNFGVQDTGDGDPVASSSQVGQTLTLERDGTLADVQVQLRRAGTLAGATRMRVERCRADDGSDDRPDGVPLAVSEPVDAGAIDSGIQGSLVTYAFASRPPLAAGGRYAFVLESDAVGSAASHLQWKIHHGDAYQAGGLVNFGRKIAWNIVAYPELGQMPFFFGEDQVTPRTAAFGTLMRVDDVPAFPAPDAWVDVADVTAQLQEWVDDRSYAPRGVAAIELFAAPSTAPGAIRRGKDFRLKVTWREPRA
jgi:hypothetical protein